MDELNTLISKLTTLQNGVSGVVEETIKDNEDVIIDMNAEEQLYEDGVFSDGVSIASILPYTELTMSIKRQKGQPTDRVTLRDSGDFHESFFIEYTSDGFSINAKDEKTDFLKKYYDKSIFGLTEENIVELRDEYILPEIHKMIAEL